MLPWACAWDETVTTRALVRLLQPIQEQAGEQERREVVDGEGVLEPVGRQASGVPVAADVVHQHIDPRQAVQGFGGEPSYLRLG